MKQPDFSVVLQNFKIEETCVISGRSVDNTRAVTSCTGENKTSSQPFNQPDRHLIGRGSSAAVAQLVSSHQCSGTYLGYFLYNTHFAPMVMLDDHTILLEVSSMPLQLAAAAKHKVRKYWKDLGQDPLDPLQL